MILKHSSFLCTPSRSQPLSYDLKVFNYLRSGIVKFQFYHLLKSNSISVQYYLNSPFFFFFLKVIIIKDHAALVNHQFCLMLPCTVHRQLRATSRLQRFLANPATQDLLAATSPNPLPPYPTLHFSYTRPPLYSLLPNLTTCLGQRHFAGTRNQSTPALAYISVIFKGIPSPLPSRAHTSLPSNIPYKHI